MPKYPGDLGVLLDLAGVTQLLLTDTTVEIQIGAAQRANFTCHVEFDGATALTAIQLILDVSYDNTNWASVACYDAADDTLAAPALFPAAAGPVQDVQLYTEAARGAPYARIRVRAVGAGPVKAGDKVAVSGTFW